MEGLLVEKEIFTKEEFLEMVRVVNQEMKRKIGKRMMGSREKIPNEVLKEIFPRKLKRSLASEWVYSQLKQMIFSGKLKKGHKLMQDGIAQDFNVSQVAVGLAFSQLKKDGLIISKVGTGSFVV